MIFLTMLNEIKAIVKRIIPKRLYNRLRVIRNYRRSKDHARRDLSKVFEQGGEPYVTNEDQVIIEKLEQFDFKSVLEVGTGGQTHLLVSLPRIRCYGDRTR